MAKFQDWITQDGLLIVEGWARDGLTDEQIAGKIGICRDTLYEWKKRYPDIADAIKRGKAPVDYQVENALLRRAVGYYYNESRMDENGATVTTRKHQPPDTAAAIFWLKNRRRDRWREKPDTSDCGNNELLLSLHKLMLEGK